MEWCLGKSLLELSREGWKGLYGFGLAFAMDIPEKVV